MGFYAFQGEQKVSGPPKLDVHLLEVTPPEVQKALF